MQIRNGIDAARKILDAILRDNPVVHHAQNSALRQ
jgi:hypothetical protein